MIGGRRICPPPEPAPNPIDRFAMYLFLATWFAVSAAGLYLMVAAARALWAFGTQLKGLA